MAKRPTARENQPMQIAEVDGSGHGEQPMQIAEVAGGYDRRVCVPAPMPVQCPHCRSTRTTAANGVHYNLHFGSRYEHRVCSACGFTFTAMRRMTEEELARHADKKRV